MVLKIERVQARDLQSYRGRRILLLDDSGNTLACAWQDFRLDESGPQPRVTVHIIEWQRWFDTPDYHLAADGPVEVLLDG